MSRLEKYLQRKKRKIIFILIITLIIIFYLFLNYGISLLINSVLFFRNFQETKNNSLINKNLPNKNDLYLLDIEDIPIATNSSKIVIKGSTFNLAQLIFYLNKKKVAEKNLMTDESFIQIIDNLIEETNNEILIKALNKENKIVKESKKYLVYYKKNKPKLEISQPEDNKKIDQSSVIIKGKTDKETIIKINDYPVVVDALGEFEHEVNLNEGENKIKIQATDIAGNQEEKTLTVIYEKED